MTNRRMAEATINASLDAHLHGAREDVAGANAPGTQSLREQWRPPAE